MEAPFKLNLYLVVPGERTSTCTRSPVCLGFTYLGPALSTVYQETFANIFTSVSPTLSHSTEEMDGKMLQIFSSVW